MVPPGFLRWALIMVIVALVLAAITGATVVMANALLQPKVVPTIKVEPAVVGPGEIVVVSGEGWPNLANLVLVVALSPTRDLAIESLVPVGAAPVAVNGTIAATFVFPSEVPWSSLREAWVVMRPGTGSLQAVAHLWVRRARPTATPTPDSFNAPLSGRQQIQGTVVEVAAAQGMLIVRPFDGNASRAVALKTAFISFLDGRSARVADLQVGISVSAAGWPDSAGTLLAERITILESVAAVSSAAVSVANLTCTPAVGIPTCSPIPQQVVVVPACTPIPRVVVVVVPTCTPIPVLCPATACPAPAPTCPPAGVCQSSLCPTLCPASVPAGRFAAEFFANASFAGAPVAVQEQEVVDLDWYQDPPVAGLPRHGYSIRWTGTWVFPRSTRYRFLLLLRGSARLSVDGRTLLDLGGNLPAAEFPAEADLAQGPHRLELDFVDTCDRARVQLRWEFGAAAPG